jgi:hypothetical protein
VDLAQGHQPAVAVDHVVLAAIVLARAHQQRHQQAEALDILHQGLDALVAVSLTHRIVALGGMQVAELDLCL